MPTADLDYSVASKIICVVVCLIGMITDIAKGRIYNWLTFPGIIVGWVLGLYFDGLNGLGHSLLGTITSMVLWFPLALIGAYGMGDVKIMGAIGAICGSCFVLNVSLYAFALGFFHALIILFMNNGTAAILSAIVSIKSGSFRYNTIKKENADNKNKIKFHLGIDIFLGVLIACWHIFSW